MTKYAILQQDNTPIAASPAAVKAHIEAELGGQHPVSVIRQWTEAYRNEMGIYTIVETKAALLDYQTHQAQPLAFADGKVTRSYTAVDVNLDTAKEQAKAALASKRYDVETGGITVSALEIATDRHTQSVLTAARILAKEDANYSVNWKGPQGWLVVNAAEIIAMADTVAAHVQACFDNEKALSEQIDAAVDVDALRQIDIESGW